MTPEDVDICVTCVTDKPPMLPLREELVSLGVEVIYNANGVGGKAVRHETKQLVKDYRKAVEKKKKGWCNFPKSREARALKIQQQKQIERQLKRECKSVSYDTYNNALLRTDSDESSSLCSLNSLVTKEKRRDKKAGKHRMDQMAAVPEFRQSVNDRRENAISQSQAVMSSYDTFHQVDQAAAQGTVTLSSSLQSPKSGNRREQPLSAATSPTLSQTTFSQDASSASGRDDESESSTIEKYGDTDKCLVSGTGNRWWYEKQTKEKQTRAQAEHRNEPGAPLLPPLNNDTREEAPTVPDTSKGSWCGLNTMCGWGKSHEKESKATGESGDDIIRFGSMSNVMSSSSDASDPSTMVPTGANTTHHTGESVSQSFTADMGVSQADSRSHDMEDSRSKLWDKLNDDESSLDGRDDDVWYTGDHDETTASFEDRYHSGENESDDDETQDHKPTITAINDSMEEVNDILSRKNQTEDIISSASSDLAAAKGSKVNTPAPSGESKVHSGQECHQSNAVVPVSPPRAKGKDMSSHQSRTEDVVTALSSDSNTQQDWSDTPIPHGGSKANSEQTHRQSNTAKAVSPSRVQGKDILSRESRADDVTRAPSSEANTTQDWSVHTPVPTGDSRINSEQTPRRSNAAKPLSPSSAATTDASTGSKSLSSGSDERFDGEGGRTSKRELFTMLSASVVSIEEIQHSFHHSPSLARAKWSREDGRLPLHVVCDRNLPDRFHGRAWSLLETLDKLANDLIQWKRVIEAVLQFNVNGCKIADKNGDLPVHVAARRLIEWEGQWRTKLGGVSALPESAAMDIDLLHQEMVQLVEILLDPILKSRGLCRKRGSVRTILPLHIASIFPVSVEKMETLLRTYPEAASIPCDLGPLLTLIVNHSMPLELLERDRSVGASIESDNAGKDVGSDEVKRSNMLFAYHPNVDPFRYEQDRLASLELLIIDGAKRLCKAKRRGEIAKLDVAAHSGWVWLCTFDVENARVDYSINVKNVVYALEFDEVKLLSEVKTFSGALLKTATPKCKEIITSRLDGKERNAIESPIPSAQVCLTIQSSTSSLTGSVIRKDYYEDVAQSVETRRSCNFVAALIRKVFNVQEHAHPTSFIVLPYKLVAGPDGALTLDTPTAAPVAIKFAQYLLEMTQPQFLNHQLEKKSIQHAGYRLSVHEMENWTLTEEKHRNIQRELFAIYRSNPAYLYLIDEKDGVPIVRGERREKYYPIRIEDPVDTVRRLFPLMLMGMVHMRGEKSLATLMKTIVAGGLPAPESWVSTAEDILDLLILDTQDQDTVVSAALSRKDDLVDFVGEANKNPDNRRPITPDGYEWVVELTLLKLTIERSDIRRSFAGLTPVKAPNGETIWTKAKNLEPTYLMAQRSREMDRIPRSRANSDTESLLGIESIATTESKVLDQLLNADEPPSNRLIAPRNPSPARARHDAHNCPRSRDASPLRPRLRKPSPRRPRSRHASPLHPRQQNSLPTSSTEKSQDESALNKSAPHFLQSSSIDSTDSGSSKNWRTKLEKQESHLNQIRDSLHSIDVSDSEQLSLWGEKLVDDVSQQLSLYDVSSATSHRPLDHEEEEEDHVSGDCCNDTDKTKKLLLRLCNLEERLLTREIDLQQIKLDLHNFELQAASRSKEWE